MAKTERRSIFDIVCIGNTTIDYIGNAGKARSSSALILVDEMIRSFGGRGSNFSVFASAFGSSVLLAAKVGNDFDSSGYADHFRKFALGTAGLLHDRGTQTDTVYVFNMKDASKVYFYGMGPDADDSKLASHVRRICTSNHAKAVYCTHPLKKLNIFSLLHSRGLRVFSPAHSMEYFSKRELELCFSNSDILFANEYETDLAKRIVGKSLKGIIRDFGLDIVVKTRGARGCEVISAHEDMKVRPCRPNMVVDPTGAGDAFAGTFVSSYIENGNLLRSARVASSAASFVVEKFGCQSNVPTREQTINRAMLNYPGMNRKG